ncbi:hypothetical protein J1N35_023554 [Gossypium stocksii]|uniref:Uncharacterized protein n=1 Tax=Gossypium stocksii TaxID=47602 RepID=A0A9D3VJ10_9ROSI|nr:hypothetical protein J1N35_023554 [Gossypium stocksii]
MSQTLGVGSLQHIGYRTHGQRLLKPNQMMRKMTMLKEVIWFYLPRQLHHKTLSFRPRLQLSSAQLGHCEMTLAHYEM